MGMIQYGAPQQYQNISAKQILFNYKNTLKNSNCQPEIDRNRLFHRKYILPYIEKTAAACLPQHGNESRKSILSPPFAQQSSYSGNQHH